MRDARGGDRRLVWRGRLQRPIQLVGLVCIPAILAAAVLGGGLGRLPSAQAQQGGWQEDSGAVRHIVVTLYKSRTLRLDKPFASAVVGSPDIVDALPMSDRALYIQGKKVGTTNISVFDTQMRMVGVLDVEVTPDIGTLQEKIRSSTGSGGIRVGSSNGQIVLSGTARDAVAADRAMQVARSMVPEGGSIVNAMKVAPSQQVMLKVRFMEVARSASRELGVNWFGGNSAGNRGFATGVGGLTGGQPGGRPAVTGVDTNGNLVPSPGAAAQGAGGAPGLPIFTAAGTLLSGATPFGVAVANLASNSLSLDVVLTALETKGLIRQLAEPELIALSGDTASFLAGGEYPVPTCQTSTTGVCAITIQYQPFGVQLTFNPTVLENGIINLRLAPSVSELNFALAVTINGFNIPSINKREARTTVELRDGQSFSIAGLLQLDNRRNISQLPWIGSVPVLGALFGSKQFQDTETDLVVIVTPHLVAPGVPGQQLASPLDNHVPTNDVDFFLMGQMEQRKEYREYVTSGGGIQGPYGHIIATAPPGPAVLAPGGAVLSTKN